MGQIYCHASSDSNCLAGRGGQNCNEMPVYDSERRDKMFVLSREFPAPEGMPKEDKDMETLVLPGSTNRTGIRDSESKVEFAAKLDSPISATASDGDVPKCLSGGVRKCLSDRSRLSSKEILASKTTSFREKRPTRMLSSLSRTWCVGPHVEAGVKVGSDVIAKLNHAWIGTPYVYGKVESLNPIEISTWRGNEYVANDLLWVMLAQDDGWLPPYGLDWQQPGRHIIMQLMSQEWISVRVAATHTEQPVQAGLLLLEVEGLEDITSVCIQTDVAFLFTPHEECLEEFGHSKCRRGGRLADHIADAFEPALPEEGESSDNALVRQRRRWVERSRDGALYPIRTVWVSPQVKEGAINEFAHRASQKKLDSPTPITPEAVMLVGPPAAGKSSIGRLKPEQLTGKLKLLRKTVTSMQYREEVNNDNLIDCVPGFAYEYKYALAIDGEDKPKTEAKRKWQRAKSALQSREGFCMFDSVRTLLDRLREKRQEELSAESWALRWLTYLVYHQGVRDSLAIDSIKVTIVDASELPVYYSSCMAGKAMARAMLILDLSHSTTKPVPHKALPFRGFWPYTSQEARFDRQAFRHREETQDRKLKGGNLTSNLVNLHYHAQQAETNITKMLDCLHRGVKPSDEIEAEGEEETTALVDHFLVLDNEHHEPKVLLDFASYDLIVDGDLQSELLSTITRVIEQRELFVKEWDPFDLQLYKICYFLLKFCVQKDHPLYVEARAVKRKRGVNGIPDTIDAVLPMVTEIDEEIFACMYRNLSTATQTVPFRAHQSIGNAARINLAHLPQEVLEDIKTSISVLRKHTCLFMMRLIRDEGDWQDALIGKVATVRSSAIISC